MYPLNNRSGELIAYLHQNAILHPDSLEVMGVLLGNCVFDPQARMLGKYFHNKLYTVKGELLATSKPEPEPVPQKLSSQSWMRQTWQILDRIKDHICPWVPEKDNWSKSSLVECLQA